MKKALLVLLLAHQAGVAAAAQTLCRPGETDHFSCPARGGKIISVCSNIADGRIDDGSWLQYRFGKPGKPELVFPAEKKDSLSRFAGHYFDPREQTMATADLRFLHGRALYGVELTRFHPGGDGVQAPRFTGGATVMLGKAGRIAIPCDKVDGRRYFDAFRQLNFALDQPDAP